MSRPKVQLPPLKETDLLRVGEQEETRTERTNFPDIVKARVFARDRGMCAFMGLNLWLLDEGACGFYNVPWIDHIVPATRGGTSTEDNGVAAHWAYNYNQSDNRSGKIYLFLDGLPTHRYFEYHRRLTAELAQTIADNAAMHHSDWYFNQALACLFWGIIWLHAGKEAGYKRDDAYYAKAALGKLHSWRHIVQREAVAPMDERNLVADPLYADQVLLLSLKDKESEEDIQKLMNEVLPYHAANLELKLAFEEAYPLWLEGDDGAFAAVDEKLTNPLVSDAVAEDIIWNIRLLADPFRDWNAEDETPATS